SAIRGGPTERILDDREALRTWMTNADALNEPLSVRRHWVHRFEQDFRSGYSWQAVFDPLPVEQQHRFAANFNELTRLMLVDKADAWYSRQSKRREAYLDREFADLQNWKLIGDGTSERSRRASSLLSELVRHPDRWLAGASPEQRKRFDAFRQAVEQRTWSHELRRWLPLK
ncbi:MAG TPA: hypothetical protein VHV77_09240, partial [Pirellulales bacterium]|nr:hypothetical protein [Pirellulales bacterium]